jgi:hypothetical protein
MATYKIKEKLEEADNVYRKLRYQEYLAQCFMETDVDGSGSMSYKEFKTRIRLNSQKGNAFLSFGGFEEYQKIIFV